MFSCVQWRRGPGDGAGSIYHEPYGTDVVFDRRCRRMFFTQIVSQISAITFELAKLSFEQWLVCAGMELHPKKLTEDGLVKSNMEKLTFYSLSSPEKLDRIGEYLFQKASRDIYRRRHGFVIIAMEAMDLLLVACHSQTLNLFVESFLKMVQKLLESTDPQLQILATQSFVRFANIEEDTPSYHRRYDFFVSKFSAMCHSNHSDKKMRDRIRLAGIKGLQGVIRKTVSDDLVENIWEAQHMDKIVPSLLYNMQAAEKYEIESAVEQLTAVGTDGEEEEDLLDPPKLAEACLRELVGRASFGHIRSVLRPVLTHFDRHELWVPNDYAVYVFKIIMFSIQAQYSYSVVEALMQHLDRDCGPGGGRVRAARAAVLSEIIAIAASDSVGPSVLEIINNLLTNLRASVARDSEMTLKKESDEKQYQEALINSLGEFADHLPDFQKIDIMMFIVSKVPSSQRSRPTKADAMLQSILLKSLLKVGTTYTTTDYSKAFPPAFLEALLRMSGTSEPSTRVLLQRILHTLLDRHDNASTLSIMMVNTSDMGLTIEKCSRPDLIFISKHGYAIYSSLYEGYGPSPSKKNRYDLSTSDSSMSTNYLVNIPKLKGRETYDDWCFAAENVLTLEGMADAIKEPLSPTATTAQKSDDMKARAKLILTIDGSLYESYKYMPRKLRVDDQLCEPAQETAQKLIGTGFEINDQWIGSLMLAGLPEKLGQ
ncbi:Protein EFR3 homolog cmp44E [Eumeta japonica]|uniref:Protein EFR3 homolog cmp44E n=1 Tax=Eumeta variegata TaxID=151549 RepID=A0A4C1XNU6_EUMVA|nr:Protein EFR3 homolog cmp44E [Eumeta japonica]